MSDRPSNLLNRFLLVMLPYMNDMISISIHKELQSCLRLSSRTTKLFTPIIKSFVALKVLIQSERTRWFTAGTLRSAFVQGIVRVGYLLSLFYYELLVCLMLLYVYALSCLLASFTLNLLFSMHSYHAM